MHCLLTPQLHLEGFVEFVPLRLGQALDESIESMPRVWLFGLVAILSNELQGWAQSKH